MIQRLIHILGTDDRARIALHMLRLAKDSHMRVLSIVFKRTNRMDEMIISLLYISQILLCSGILSVICLNQISILLRTCSLLLRIFAKQDVDIYFMHIHPWIPFLSKRNILGQVLSPLSGRRLDHSILLTAIKLIVTTPDDEARSVIYYEIKKAILNAELMGIFTLRLLQAVVLVALYELGHSIHPSAYLTVGYCAKYGIALGINRTINPNCGARPTLADSEEERRTWWAILLLDR